MSGIYENIDATQVTEFGGEGITYLKIGPVSFSGKRVKFLIDGWHSGGGASNADDSLAWVEITVGGKTYRSEDGAFVSPYTLAVKTTIEVDATDQFECSLGYGNRSAGPTELFGLRARIL